MRLSAGPLAGKTADVVFVATSNADVYALAAATTSGVAPGTVLWRTHVGDPGGVVDGLRVGIMGTPVIDARATPPRLYVAADVRGDAASGGRAWRMFALDLGNGAVLPGWPVLLDDATVSPVNQNGPALFTRPGSMSQRGGLATSPDGRLLYVSFGGYYDGSAGWLVAIDTARAAVASAFSSAPEEEATANGGMWASGGISIDADGSVWSVTGNSPAGPLARTWGESVLRWAPGVPLRLSGTYTTWNHCQLDSNDIDLCGSGVVLLPDVKGSATPRLAALGGKQGNAYLLDREHLPGGLDARPACNWHTPVDLPQDGSLWDPTAGRPYYGGKPGPLNVFGPYRDSDVRGLQAKARSTPAVFQADDGATYLVFTGATKDPVDFTTSVAPSVARLRVVTPSASQPAHLALEAYEPTLVFNSPGTPVVSSNGGHDAIAWIVEPNVLRTGDLSQAPPATLHAVDVMRMTRLWSSGVSDLGPGAKYFHPIVARGQVLVATDRLTGFGP